MTATESKCKLVPIKSTWDGLFKEFIISVDGKNIGSARERIDGRGPLWMATMETPFVKCCGVGNSFHEAMRDALLCGVNVAQTDINEIKSIAVSHGEEISSLSPE